MKNNLTVLSKRYNNLRDEMDKIESDSSYYESVLLKYKGVECYIDELSLYFGKVKLRVNNVDLNRFDGNKKVIELSTEEFDAEVVTVQ